MNVALTVCGLTAERVTVKVALTEPELPSLTTGALAMESDGPSLSSMVPTPTASTRFPSLWLVSVTLNVSSTSSRLSADVCTVNVPLVAPAGIVSVPVRAV